MNVKLYIKLLSLTLALMYVFLTGYVSGIFVDVSGAAQAILTEKLKFYPSPAAFEAIWSTVYLLETVLLTATISEKKLRRAVTLWVVSGGIDILAAYALFEGKLFAFAFALILVSFFVNCRLTLFYAEHSPLAALPEAAVTVWRANLAIYAFLLLT